MKKRIAINGFGRIGRAFLRAIMYDDHARSDLDVVAINVGPKICDNLALLFKYDSIMREFKGTVTYGEGCLTINNHDIKIIAEADPVKLPWRDLNIDWVVESSGRFTSRDKALLHCQSGSKKVLITAPASDADVAIVPGVNDMHYDKHMHMVVSLGSCTTNAFAPLVKVIQESWKMQTGLMTTIHAYTNDQVLLDIEHKDPRRARAAAVNTIPTKTGADKVIIQLFPELAGKIKAGSLRVPVVNVSFVDFVFTTKQELSYEVINETFKKYANNQLKNILHYSDEPLVSSDFIGNAHSSIFDSLLTQSVGTTNKVCAWYDNEWGYASRLKDFLLHND